MHDILVAYVGSGHAQNAARALNRVLGKAVLGLAFRSDGNADHLQEIFTTDAEGNFTLHFDGDLSEPQVQTIATEAAEYRFMLLKPLAQTATE